MGGHHIISPSDNVAKIVEKRRQKYNATGTDGVTVQLDTNYILK